MFFATRPLTNLTPHDFFAATFWLGFSIHLIAADASILHTNLIRVHPCPSVAK